MWFAGRRAEGALGVESFSIYVAGVNLACGVATSSALFSLYVLTRFEHYLFEPVYGFGGVAASLAVALKLVAPREPFHPALPSLQCQHLPTLMCLLVLIGSALGVEACSADLPFVLFGTYFGWVYLRFVHHGPSGTVGDVSDEFALVTLFPPGLRRCSSALSVSRATLEH